MANLSSQIERLRRENARLRAQLRDQRRVVDDDVQFTLAMLSQMPITFWACDRDCKIQYWNKHAERLYGYRKDEALGRDYIDLFVDPFEAEQARLDAVDIIDNGRHIQNIANDRDRYGNVRRLLTNCFPVLHEGRGETLQVEFSFEISNLHIFEADVDRIRQRGLALIQEKETGKSGNTLLKKVQESAMSRVTAVYEDQARLLSEKIESTRTLLANYPTGKTRKEYNEKKLEELLESRVELKRWARDMQASIIKAESVEDMEPLQDNIEAKDA